MKNRSIFAAITLAAAMFLSACGDGSPVVDADTTEADTAEPGDPRTGGRDAPEPNQGGGAGDQSE